MKIEQITKLIDSFNTENSPEIIAVLDQHGVILWVSENYPHLGNFPEGGFYSLKAGGNFLEGMRDWNKRENLPLDEIQKGVEQVLARTESEVWIPVFEDTDNGQTLMLYLVDFSDDADQLLLARLVWRPRDENLLLDKSKKAADHLIKDFINRSYFDNSPLGILCTDPQGLILYQNPMIKQIIKIPEHVSLELEGRFIHMLPKIVETGQDEIYLRLLKGESIKGELVDFHTEFGEHLMLEIHGEPIKDDLGNMEGTVIIYLDATDRKTIERENLDWKLRYETAVEASGNILYEWDAEKNNVIFGGDLEKVLGYSAEAMTGGIDKWISLIHPDESDKVAALLLGTENKDRSLRMEYRMKHKDGYYIDVEDSGIFICNEEGVARLRKIGFVKDISAIKQIDREKQLQNINLSVINMITKAGIEMEDEKEFVYEVIEILKNHRSLNQIDIFMLDELDFLIVRDSFCSDSEFGKISSIHQCNEFLFSELMNSSRAFKIDDTVIESDFQPLHKNTRSSLLVPINSGDKMIGVIWVENPMPGGISNWDVRLYTTVAGVLVNTMEKLRVLHNLKRMANELQSLYDSSLSLGKLVSEDVFLGIVEEAIQRVVPTDISLLAILDEDQESVGLRFVHGFDDRVLPPESTMMLNDTFYTKRAVETKQPLLIKNACDSEEYPVLEILDHKISSFLAIPLIVGERVSAVLIGCGFNPYKFTEAHEQYLNALAPQIGIALENIRLFSAEKKQRMEAESQREISKGLSIHTTMDELVVNFFSSLAKVVEFDSGGILLINQKSMAVEHLASAGMDYKIANDFFQDVIAFGSPINIPDIREDDRIIKNGRPNYPLSVLGVPLVAGGENIGVLTLDHKEKGVFSEKDVATVQSFANQVASAILRAQLLSKSQKQVDQLKTLYQMDQLITSNMNIKSILNLLVRQITLQLEVDAAAILLYHPKMMMFEYVTEEGFERNNLIGSLISLRDYPASEVALNHKVVSIENLAEKGDFTQPVHEGERFLSYLGVPLVTNGELHGILEICNHSPFKPNVEGLEFVHALASQAAIAINNDRMITNLQKMNMQIMDAYDSTLEGWAKALEMRDRETEGHSKRVTRLSVTLAQYMGMDGEELINMRRGAILHDIGKMSIPDRILQKEGELTYEEWQIMRKHPEYAYNWLSGVSFLQPALDVPYCHHEKWDGSGYPRGIAGKDIPLAARIFAVVDVYDALRSNRPYRSAWNEDRVLAYIEEQSGKHFDPDVVAAFLAQHSSNPTVMDLYGTPVKADAMNTL